MCYTSPSYLYRTRLEPLWSARGARVGKRLSMYMHMYVCAYVCVCVRMCAYVCVCVVCPVCGPLLDRDANAGSAMLQAGRSYGEPRRLPAWHAEVSICWAFAPAECQRMGISPLREHHFGISAVPRSARCATARSETQAPAALPAGVQVQARRGGRFPRLLRIHTH